MLKSTNSHAAILRKRGDLPAPAIILTPNQTAGRGRGANSWSSPPGNLTVTFAFPAEPQLQPHHLPLIAGVAVRHATAQLTNNSHIQLKWPNDIVVSADCGLPIAELNKKSPTQSAIRNPQSPLLKLAGLLCERLDNLDLIGIGLNVNLDPRKAPKDLRCKLTSLRTLAGHPFDLTDVLLTLAAHLQRALIQRHSQPFPAFLQEYDQHHALLGRNLSIIGPPNTPLVTGRCLGLDSTGRLLLKNRSTTHAIIAGHVVLNDSLTS
jgi:BirA family biotin operon repressor/biotin-[acetyl-CoA-carboxylase] ligase